MNRVIMPGLVVIWLALTAVGTSQVPIGGALSDGAGGPLLTGTVYSVTSGISVPAGTTLTIQAGAIVKFNLSTDLVVSGNLVVAGTSGQPVIFTDINDDSAGGDTNGNGPSSGITDWWRGLTFTASSTGTVTRLDLRFGGRFGSPGISINGGSPTITSSTVSFCSNAGLSLNNVASSAVISGCQFNDNNRAIEGVQLASLPGLTNNTATGNAAHDSLALGSGAIGMGSTAITAANMVSNVIIASGISVASGATLTFGAGCIVKWNLDGQFIVDGMLVCNGTAPAPVVFTDLRDDAHGGDTNKDGASVGTSNWWRGIVFNATSGGSLTRAQIWYAGRFATGGIEVFSAPVALNSCLVQACAALGLDLNNQPAAVNVTACDFVGNGGGAVGGVPIVSVPGFHFNTASANAVSNTIVVGSGTVASGTTTILPENMISSVIVCPGLVVAAGATLVFDAGCIVKWTLDGQATIDGALICNGTGGNPVVFTDLRDDARGGDTNLDGPSTGAGDWWRTISFSATSGASLLTGTEVRFAGRFGNAGIEISGSPLTLTSCVVQGCTGAGLDMNNIPAALDVAGCSFMGNGRAVVGVPLVSVPGFHNNTASGNTTHDSLAVAGFAVASGSTTILPENMISNVIIMNGLSVAGGATLTFQAGCIVKWNQDAIATIDGALLCQGLQGAPVVFTDLRDDANGGDTNKNGFSSGAPDWWRGFTFNAGSDASVLERTVIRYGGRFASAGVVLLSDATLRNATVEFCTHRGISLGGSLARPTVRGCTVRSCGNVAIADLRWRSLLRFANNQVIGNAQNYAQVSLTNVGVDDRVFAHALPNGVVVMAANPTFTATSSLILEAGVVVKVGLDTSFNVTAGRFEARGTAYRPVTFTDLRDDTIGGDTNGDGPSVGAPAWWRGMSVGSGAIASTLDHLVIRYGGRFATTGLVLGNPGVSVPSLRVEHFSALGVQVQAMAGQATNWVVASCQNGVQLNGPNLFLLHATVADCSGVGVAATGAFSGAVVNTISWNNGGGNYTGLTAATIARSNGSPSLVGINGNIDADPLFVDAANGDYRLQAASPCLAAGDVPVAHLVREDHLEGTREADHDLSGVFLPDMGAFERVTWTLDVQGEPALLQTQVYTLVGPAAGVGLLLLNGVSSGSEFFNEYGWLLIGTASQVSLAAVIPPGFGSNVAIPDEPSIVGFPFQVQGIVLSALDTTKGNFTQRYRGVVRP